MVKLDPVTAKAISDVIERNQQKLQSIFGFVSARPGFPIRAGKVVSTPVLIVYVERKRPVTEIAQGGEVPKQIEGIFTDTVAASVEMILRAKYGIELQAAVLAAKPTYVEPDDGNIDAIFPVDSKFVCHVGPDDGTNQLRDHLRQAKQTLTVGMYDFNADYLANALIEQVLAEGVQFTLTLDDGLKSEEKKICDKLRQKMPHNYTGWMVQCRYTTRFPTAYHIKVSVADHEHMWLSSGNWTTRSQPDIDPTNKPEHVGGMFTKGNREWHICISDEALAKEFEKYLLYDAAKSEEEGTALAVAPAATRPVWPDAPYVVVTEQEDAALAPPKVFPAIELPVEQRTIPVRPVLSPDNYVPKMRELISSAKKSLYMQMPYISWSTAPEDEDFRELILLIADKSNELEDVRIILGTSDAQVKIPMLVEQGMRADCIRTQGSLHNKGFIVDGKWVLVSSHNWSSDGVLRNRDAGVIIEDREVTGFYNGVFLWDWDHRAREYVDSAALTVRVEPTRVVVAEGEQVMTLEEFLNP